MTKRSLFRYFKTSPEIIRLAAMIYWPCHVVEWKVIEFGKGDLVILRP
jgi:hypothetical protein